jgi:hypothetical protein
MIAQDQRVRSMMNDGEPDWDLDEDEIDKDKDEQEEEDAREIASLRNQ